MSKPIPNVKIELDESGSEGGSRPLIISCRSHNQLLIDGLWQFFQSRHDTDFIFRWGGRSIPAHRNILEVFLTPEKLGRQEAAAGIKLERPDSDEDDDDDGGILGSIMEFLYTGEVTVPEEQGEELLEVAKQLDFRLLVDAVQTARAGSQTPPPNQPRHCGVPVKSRSFRSEEEELRSVFEPVLELVEPSKITPRSNWDHPVSESESGSGEAERWRDREIKGEPADDYSDTMACDLSGSDYPRPFGSSITGDGGMNAFECPPCEFRTSDGFTFRRHLELVHGAPPQPSTNPEFSCPDCQFVTRCWRQMKKHVADTHAKEKRFCCSHCNFVTNLKGTLKHHGDVVHGLGPGQFTCDTCGKRCASRSDLVRHGRTHTKERPFKCPHCEYASGWNGDLKKHIEFAHTEGPIRFACDTCGKRCASQAALIIHNRTHTRERPFKCPHCAYDSGRRYHLKIHLKKVHKTILDNAAVAALTSSPLPRETISAFPVTTVDALTSSSLPRETISAFPVTAVDALTSSSLLRETISAFPVIST